MLMVLNELHEKYPALDLHIHKINSNLGFAAANNLSAHLARGKWLALLNGDAFPEPDWLEQLVRDAHENPEFTFFASRQIQATAPELLDGTGDAYHASKYGLQSGEVFSVCADVLDLPALTEAMRGADFVFHLAATSWGVCLFFESLKIFNIIPFGDTHTLASRLHLEDLVQRGRPRNSSLYDRIAAESEVEARPPERASGPCERSRSMS